MKGEREGGWYKAYRSCTSNIPGIRADWALGQDAWGGTYIGFRIVESSRTMPVSFIANVRMQRRISMCRC